MKPTCGEFIFPIPENQDKTLGTERIDYITDRNIFDDNMQLILGDGESTMKKTIRVTKKYISL